GAPSGRRAGRRLALRARGGARGGRRIAAFGTGTGFGIRSGIGRNGGALHRARGRHRRTTHARDAPDDVGQVVGDDHRATRIHGHAHRTAAGGAVVIAETGGEVDRVSG